jgi:hypothetical protein
LRCASCAAPATASTLDETSCVRADTALAPSRTDSLFSTRRSEMLRSSSDAAPTVCAFAETSRMMLCSLR